ncbi:hypothetical protein [Pseudoalteromonas distincta]|nr:hypothetical protein [Pseudoalteromonas distincta]
MANFTSFRIITNHVLLCALLLSPVINAAQEPILPTTPEQCRRNAPVLV